MSKLLSSLDTSQREAVTHENGPLLVLAGAGSGKTRILTHRIANLTQRNVCSPENILALTFTNKAANEMRNRLSSLVSEKLSALMTISTFHSLGARILRKEGDRVGIRKNFSIMDSNDRKSAVKTILRNRVNGSSDIKPGTLLSRISLAKSSNISPSEYSETPGSDPLTAKVYASYEKWIRGKNQIDFDDLLILPLRIFRKENDILEKYRRKFRYISIDEFQDTNRVQLDLAKLLANPLNNVMAVGDDDQGIYSWRGAEINNIINFKRHFPNPRTVILKKNYRSTEQIVNAAYSVIQNNPERKEKDVKAASGRGEPLIARIPDDEASEATWIAETIKHNKTERKYGYGDQALLFRTNSMMRRFEEELRAARIPYRVIGATGFYDRKEIKDVTAYLKFINNPYDEISMARVLNAPNRGITKESIKRIERAAGEKKCSMIEAMESSNNILELAGKQYSRVREFTEWYKKYTSLFKEQSLSETANKCLEETGYFQQLEKAYKKDGSYERRLENIKELIHSLEIFENRSGNHLGKYLQELSIVTSNENQADENSSGKVSLLTVHKAKGLEFPVVFLPGLDDSVFPSPNAITEGRNAEERRLFYVGMTRAEKLLILTWPQTKIFRKKRKEVKPCRYIKEISTEYFDSPPGEKEKEELQEFKDNFLAIAMEKFGKKDQTNSKGG